METTKVQKWNQLMKMIYFGMIMIAILSIVNTVLEWSHYFVNYRFYDYDYSKYYDVKGLITKIISYLCTSFWVFSVIWLFCLTQLINEKDRNGWSLFKIGALVYTSLAVLGIILSLADINGIGLATILLFVRMGCFVVMMIGAIKLSSSNTFPNSKGMSMIMIATIFIILSYFCYFMIYIMIYNENYNNLDVFSNVGNVFSLVSDIFWLIGWVKLSKKVVA